MSRFSVPLALLVVLGGCARNIPDASPADIPVLRQQVQADPGDEVTATRLGIALHEDGQHGEAERVLSRLVEDDDAIGATYLYLGLAREAQEEWDGAREAYQSYLEAGQNEQVKEEIRGRLALIVRNELRQQARRTLAREAELADTEPAPRSVAVFPFRLVSENAELEPLEVALADMMITDLSLAGGLTVLERAQVQTLLDEMALSEAGYTETSTGARAGRLLQAEHVIQGALTTTGSDQIRLDADVLNTQSGGTAGDVTEEEVLDALFDMEKEVVFGVLEVLNVELTPAERQAINDNRSENVLALLAYGQGLEALDQGNYGQAAQFFQQSVQLDPGFSAAQANQSQAVELDQAAQTSTEEMSQQAEAELQAPGVAPAPSPSTAQGSPVENTLASVDQGTNGTNANDVVGGGGAGAGGGAGNNGQDRDEVQEAGGNDGGTRANTFRFILTIKRPTTGGGQ